MAIRCSTQLFRSIHNHLSQSIHLFEKLDVPAIAQAITRSTLRLVSAVTGFFRNSILTSLLGFSGILDLYFIVQTIYALVDSFFAQMGNSILLPAYNNQFQTGRNPAEVQKHQTRVILVFFSYMRILTIIIALLLYWGNGTIMSILDLNKKVIYPEFMQVMLAVGLPISILACGSSALNVILVQRKKISLLFIPEILSNIFFISVFLGIFPIFKENALIILFPISQLIIWAIYWYSAKIPLSFNWAHHYFVQLKCLILPNTFVWLIASVTPLIESYYLSLLPAGHLSIYRYSFMLLTVLLSVTLQNYQLSITPGIMLAGSQRHFSLLRKIMYQGQKQLFLYSIPLVVLCYWLAPLILPLIFKHGKITQEDAHLLVFSFQILVLQLPPIAGQLLTGVALNSLHVGYIKVLLSSFSLLTRVILGWIGLSQWGMIGLLWMFTLATYLNFTANYLYFLNVIRHPPVTVDLSH